MTLFLCFSRRFSMTSQNILNFYIHRALDICLYLDSECSLQKYLFSVTCSLNSQLLQECCLHGPACCRVSRLQYLGKSIPLSWALVSSSVTGECLYMLWIDSLPIFAIQMPPPIVFKRGIAAIVFAEYRLLGQCLSSTWKHSTPRKLVTLEEEEFKGPRGQ